MQFNLCYHCQVKFYTPQFFVDLKVIQKCEQFMTNRFDNNACYQDQNKQLKLYTISLTNRVRFSLKTGKFTTNKIWYDVARKIK